MYIEFIKQYLTLKVGQVLFISDLQGKKLIADEFAKKSTEKKLIAYNNAQLELTALARKSEQEKATQEAELKSQEPCEGCGGNTSKPCKDCEEKALAETDK